MTALIKAGARAKVANRYGVTPLHVAGTTGNVRVIDLLLGAGADVATALPSGETALMRAAKTGRVDAVRALLVRGADVQAKERLKGQTALMWAAAENNAAVVPVLVAAGRRRQRALRGSFHRAAVCRARRSHSDNAGAA